MTPLVSEWGRDADGLSSSESPPASARPLTAASGTGLRRTSSSMEEEAAAVRLQERARGNLERHSIERREMLSHELLQSERDLEHLLVMLLVGVRLHLIEMVAECLSDILLQNIFCGAPPEATRRKS